MDSLNDTSNIIAPGGPNTVVQFDLANPITEDQMQNTFFGRRKLPNDPCKDAKEALVWNSPESPIGRAGNKKKTMA